ncbi:hypothetical protein [Lysinibacillus contaminans]|nr:hypothetical protein [Lysinibacillus contaminans]
MEEITFKEHERKIKNDLALDDTVKVLVGTDAKKYVEDHKGDYKKNII